MSEHKPLPVAGYSSQSEENVALVNQNKILEERVLRQLDLVASFSDVDQRWAAVARTHLEQGFMALNRAVFRPGRIVGDLPPNNI
jgi:hypothetical protein